MKGTILLNHNESTKQIEEEEKSNFLKSLLNSMGVPIDDFWTDQLLTPIQKIKLKNILTSYNIQVIDDNDGIIQVYVENEKIGEWHKPTYKLKSDLSQKDKNKRLFLEMTISYWSIFEETDEETRFA